MFNAFLEPCYPRGIDTNGNRVVAAVALEARYRWHRRKSQIIQSGAAGGAAILYLRFVVSLAVATQDSRPSGSLLLSRKELSSSASCRFSPAHRNGDLIGIGAAVARGPLPHHRAYGSVHGGSSRLRQPFLEQCGKPERFEVGIRKPHG